MKDTEEHYSDFLIKMAKEIAKYAEKYGGSEYDILDDIRSTIHEMR